MTIASISSESIDAVAQTTNISFASRSMDHDLVFDVIRIHLPHFHHMFLVYVTTHFCYKLLSFIGISYSYPINNPCVFATRSNQIVNDVGDVTCWYQHCIHWLVCHRTDRFYQQCSRKSFLLVYIPICCNNGFLW